MRWTVNSQMSTTLQSCLGSTLPTVSSSSMSSQSSQFSLWRSQRMCGANSQPVFVTAVTSQCRHLCRHCTIYKLFCLVGGGESAWRFRKMKDPFPRGKERNLTLNPTMPCIEHALPGYNPFMATPRRVSRREGAALVHINSTRCVSLYLCPFVLSCYDAIPNCLFIIAIYCNQ